MTRSNPVYIYAHRGARNQAADNTHAAFNKALSYAIDGIETDVQLTKDEVSILYHDRVLDKLAYPNQHICDFTYDELKQLNFSHYFAGAKREGVITLHEFITRYKNKCKLQIEIKHRDWENIEAYQIKIQQCLNIIGTNRSKNLNIIISSFNLDCLQYAHQLGTNIPLFYTFKETHRIDEVKSTQSKNKFLAGICHPIATLNKNLVYFLRDQNKLILTYTCNTQQEIQKALDLEVDVLITDEPATALQMRN